MNLKNYSDKKIKKTRCKNNLYLEIFVVLVEKSVVNYVNKLHNYKARA